VVNCGWYRAAGVAAAVEGAVAGAVVGAVDAAVAGAVDGAVARAVAGAVADDPAPPAVGATTPGIDAAGWCPAADPAALPAEVVAGARAGEPSPGMVA